MTDREIYKFWLSTELALQHAVIVAIDDYEFTDWHRIDDRLSKMSIFLKD